MKTYKRLLIIAMTVLMFNACEQEYIDPISKVDPGNDATPPAVTLTSPTGDIIIPFTDEQTDLNIQFEVTDDIEIGSIVVSVDGSPDSTFSEFKDYRRFANSVVHRNLGLGEHTVQVQVTDLSGKETTKSLTFEVSNQYVAKYAGEIFYMPFEGGLYMDLLAGTEATVVGGPAFTGGKTGQAYKGATGAYLTFPTDGLQGPAFSAAFWFKVNAVPDRAGILVMGPPHVGNAADKQNNRTGGFRFFRENAGGKQRFKLNVGNGTADTWFDGGVAADVDPAAGAWVHMAFTISATECAVYINGTAVSKAAFTGVDWTGCDVLSIMSGAPRFNEWNHLSDLSLIDELRLFNKALTQQEVQAMIN
jgi:hypothetical protein